MSIEAYFRGGGDEEKELPEVVEDLRDELYLIRRERPSAISLGRPTWPCGHGISSILSRQ